MTSFDFQQFWNSSNPTGHGPIRGVFLLVNLQLLLCIGDVATDAAVDGVGHQLHPVVQCHVPHVKILVFPTECIFMCFSRYSFLGKVCPQTGYIASTWPLQGNLVCLYRSSIPGNALAHISHWYDSRPMCIFTWVVGPVLQPKSFPQTLQGNLSYKWTLSPPL